MSFRKARNFGLSLIIAILIFVGLIPTFVTFQISKHNANFLSEMQELELATRLQKIFWIASAEFHDLVDRSEGDFDSVIGKLKKALDIAQALEKELTLEETGEELAAIKKLQRQTKIFRAAVIQYKYEYEIDQSADNTAQLERIALDAQNQTNEAFSLFIADVTNDVRNNQIAIGQTMKFSQMFSMVGLVLGVLAGVLVAIFIGRALNKPIQRLVNGTKRVSNGELNFKIDDSDSDEIGQLASAFNKMSAKLKTYIEQQKKLTFVAQEAARSEKIKTKELYKSNIQLQQEADARKRVEKELILAKEKAEQSNQAKSDFLANMSHELRTPLNHIIGFTELVLDKAFGDLNADQEDYLTDVHNSSKHLLSLINDILDLSKVEAGKLEFQPSRIKIRDILERSLVMIKEKALKHGIKLTTDLDGIPESLIADVRKLKQILYNLLSNAVKFAPENGCILLAARCIRNSDEQVQNLSNPATRYLQISVEDSGIGLKQEDLARIFEPFEQVECSASRQFQGTGLGLSLTKSLVELHRGKIWAESKGEGRGATFRFTLPVGDNV